MNKFFKLFFYGNIFYGICTVALSIESNLHHGISLNSYRFYLLVFLATILYYGRIYYKTSSFVIDDRTRWYRSNRSLIKIILLFIALIIIVDLGYIAFLNRDVLTDMPLFNWVLLSIIPAIGLLYTFQIFPVRKLRKFGLLKPFVIGFVWAGIVTIFPVLFWEIRHPNDPAPLILLKLMVWLQNFLFISALAIVFDIKDYKTDKRYHLNTYPAKYGIHSTIRFIILPLALISYTALLFFNVWFDHPFIHIVIQSVPYLALILFTANIYKERNLLFYLAGIDGLMLLKAVCGIVSVSFF